MKRRDQVLDDVARWLADFNDLEEMLGERSSPSLQLLQERVQSARDQPVEAVAAAARAHFGLSPREPVHDVCGLLESQSVKVHRVVMHSDAFLGLSIAAEDGGPAVVVNTWSRLPVERWIFSAVHELGHLLLHLGAYDVDVQDEEAEQEKEAEAFASHFLMPSAAFESEWSDTAGLSLLDRVLKVKRVFRVSWRTVVYRVSEGLAPQHRGRIWQQINVEYQRRHHKPLLKLIEPDSVDASVFRDPGRLSRTSVEPATLDAHDFQGDRLARLVRRAVEAEAISLSRGGEILGLGVMEMRDLASSWIA